MFKTLCITICFFGLLLALFVGPYGCAVTRDITKELTAEDLANAEATREFAKNALKTWHLNSGFIRGALGDKISEFPVQAVDAMDELDTLATKYATEELTDFELGYSVGLRVRLLSSLVIEVIKQYAPDVLQYAPALFL